MDMGSWPQVRRFFEEVISVKTEQGVESLFGETPISALQTEDISPLGDWRKAKGVLATPRPPRTGVPFRRRPGKRAGVETRSIRVQGSRIMATCKHTAYKSNGSVSTTLATSMGW